MAIDIRANVTCSLGTLISGSISDDYIQGNGLVKTKGQCELQGILTPGIGSVVTFSYTRGGTTHQIPRRLRVLSSFADPFRNITKVELGCKLTYMEGVGPAPTVDGQASYVTGKQQQCLNGWADYPADSKLPIPVSAAGVMSLCLSKLGITASSSPLQNRFSVDKFDLSQGYVPVLGDLLVSESYFGYLDENEVLQVRDLAVEGGGGPVIDSTTLIDLDQIGVGDLPGDAVVVRYDALKLKGTIDTTTAGAAEQRKRDWEEEEVIGSPETHVVRYTDASGATVENSYVYIPYQKTVTTYGKDDSFDPTVCVLSGREGADLSDSPIKSETTERILMAQAAANYCSEVLSAGLTVDPSYVQEFKSKVVENKYDDKGELIETTEYTYEPFYKWAGGLDLQFVYATPTGSERVTLGTAAVLVQKVITKRDNIYAPVLAGTYLKAGEELIPVVEAQKVTTTTYTNWALTQQGQQAVAQIKDQTPFTTATQCSDWLNANSTTLVLSDGQVQINRGRDIVQGQKRAATADRIGGEKGERPESTGQLIYAAGAVGSDRIISMSMPYQSDDTYTRSGTVIRGNAAAMALRYGRTQNRLLMGNRYGVNVQIHPDRMPAHPYDPLYLSNGSLMVQYRANAANWAFSKDGVVASLDALFWGVAGGTGTSWAPVAPGITTFPPLPTVDGDGNTTVGSVVPPWNETVPMVGVTRTVINVSDYAYSLAPLTTAVALVTRTELTVGVRLSAEAGAFQVSGKTLLKKLRASAATFTVTGQPAGSLNNRVRRHEAGTFTVTGQSAAMRRTYNALAGDAAVFDLSGMPAGKFTGKTLKSDGAVFNLSGQNARLAAERKLTASNATFTLSGQNAAFKKSSPVVLLLHMEGADGGTTFTDSSASAHVITATSATTSTTLFKFGTSSALFGVNGYLSVPHSTDFDLADKDFTMEAWIYFTNNSGRNNFFSKRVSATSSNSFRFGYDGVGPSLFFSYSVTGANEIYKLVSLGTRPTQNAWHHVAVCRSGADIRLFVNGVQQGSTLSMGTDSVFANTQPLLVGATRSGSTPVDSVKGNMDEARIVVGQALYTANFTPPTAPFPDP